MNTLNDRFNAIFILLVLMLIGCLVLSCSRSYHSTQYARLYGTTVDRDTGDPVREVEIKLGVAGITATTDSNGTFSFEKIPAGTLVVECSHPEYNTKAIEDLVVNPFTELELSVELRRITGSDSGDPETERAAAVKAVVKRNSIGPYDGTGTLTGKIIGSDGKPASNIVIRDSEFNWTGMTDLKGEYSVILIPPGKYKVIAGDWGVGSMVLDNVEIKANSVKQLDLTLTQKESDEIAELCEESATRGVYSLSKSSTSKKLKILNEGSLSATRAMGAAGYDNTGSVMGKEVMRCQAIPSATRSGIFQQTDFNTEDYKRIFPNEFLSAVENPLSTFSIDVDAASYANIRRFINSGGLPPKDAVRIEEMINYFSYDYPQPAGEQPFSITTEISTCPWNETHRLVHIGLQGKRVETGEMPPSNLVFLLDVSGSMDTPLKLPMLKAAFRLLVGQLRPEDRVAIVVYAGSAGLVLESTPGNHKQEILSALQRLRAGGCTAGGAGIKLAYKLAKDNFIEGGNNRVILATDGDFNVGVSSEGELVRMIEEKRADGIFLTVLGFGTGNYKDSKMEQLADKGNGNYAYIDNIQEARKVLVSEMSATLLTIAKDVKIQVEFNPTRVQAYRLIGYENRMLKKEYFNDDTVDAGEIGAGHTVTALYEIVPVGVDFKLSSVDDLKYQKNSISDKALKSKELLTVKFRYKAPDGNVSRLIEDTLADRDCDLDKTSDNFRFSAAVAQFGMLLRDSEFKGDSDYDKVIMLANSSLGEDNKGYRNEFVRMVEMCKLLDSVL